MTSPFQKLEFLNGLYVFTNVGFLLMAYYRIEETLPFVIVASGIIGLAYFVRRALHQLTGG
ncbi:MAG: hypothetical protein K0S07_573 [Chlamydiales bacterium]|jgi:hypothetical protein|nr:hypothetical protein [Chlamydiales bacterium]